MSNAFTDGLQENIYQLQLIHYKTAVQFRYLKVHKRCPPDRPQNLGREWPKQEMGSSR